MILKSLYIDKQLSYTTLKSSWFLLLLSLLLSLVTTQSAQAQQYTIEVSELDEWYEFLLLPNCARHRDVDNSCIVAVINLPRDYTAQYDQFTQNYRERTGNYSQYSRTRSGMAAVISFPPAGGTVVIEHPNHTITENEIYIQPGEPGSVRYFDIEVVPYRSQIASRSRRASENNRDIFSLDFVTENETIRNENTRSGDTDSQRNFPEPEPPRDYRTGLVYSVDYIGFVRNNASFFLNDTMSDYVTGWGFALTAYYIDGFNSARAGISAVMSHGGYDQFSTFREVSEFLEYSHISVFASYAPNFDLYRSRTTYAFLYTDIGVSASLVNATYDQVIVEDMGQFIEERVLLLDIDDMWLPGFNVGMGFMFNYKRVGFHLGGLYEVLFLYDDFDGIITSIYPMAGISIRGNQ